MEKEAEQDPSMWCSEWFAAVCAVKHERAVQNLSDISNAQNWEIEEMCK